MRAPQPPSQKTAVIDPRVEEALRAAAQRGSGLSKDDVESIQVLIWDLAPEPDAIQVLLYDLAWDLEFTLENWDLGQEKAMKEIVATLQAAEEIVWLEQKIGPVHDAMLADPGRGIPAREVFASIRARHAERMKGG